MSFKFIKESKKIRITHEISDNEITWPELIEEFVDFLRGCGYKIEEGEFVEQETAE